MRDSTTITDPLCMEFGATEARIMSAMRQTESAFEHSELERRLRQVRAAWKEFQRVRHYRSAA